MFVPDGSTGWGFMITLCFPAGSASNIFSQKCVIDEKGELRRTLESFSTCSGIKIVFFAGSRPRESSCSTLDPEPNHGARYVRRKVATKSWQQGGKSIFRNPSHNCRNELSAFTPWGSKK